MGVRQSHREQAASEKKRLGESATPHPALMQLYNYAINLTAAF